MESVEIEVLCQMLRHVFKELIYIRRDHSVCDSIKSKLFLVPICKWAGDDACNCTSRFR